jgi:hypothetical protein
MVKDRRARMGNWNVSDWYVLKVVLSLAVIGILMMKVQDELLSTFFALQFFGVNHSFSSRNEEVTWNSTKMPEAMYSTFYW